jgi:hypothetical protein
MLYGAPTLANAITGRRQSGERLKAACVTAHSEVIRRWPALSIRLSCLLCRAPALANAMTGRRQSGERLKALDISLQLDDSLTTVNEAVWWRP